MYEHSLFFSYRKAPRGKPYKALRLQEKKEINMNMYELKYYLGVFKVNAYYRVFNRSIAATTARRGTANATNEYRKHSYEQ